jgi:hypothetical protein
MELPSQINGIFKIEYQTKVSRIVWSIFIPIFISVFVIGIYLSNNGLFGSGSTKPSGLAYITIIIAFFVLPVLLTFTGIKKMFQKLGLYFYGIKISDLGFEIGKLTVDFDSVELEEKWKVTKSGKILKSNWKTEKKIPYDQLSFVIFLKEHRDYKNSYFFQKFVIAKNNKVLEQYITSKGITETNTNSLVTISNGSFKKLKEGNIQKEKNCHYLLEPLEQIADLFSNLIIDNRSSCTLNLVPKTVGSLAYPYGVVGALVASGIDSVRNDSMREKYKDSKLFDSEFNEKLIDFLERRKWTLIMGGQEI